MQNLQKNQNIQGIQENPSLGYPHILYEGNTCIEAAGSHFVISREFSNMLVLQSSVTNGTTWKNVIIQRLIILCNYIFSSDSPMSSKVSKEEIRIEFNFINNRFAQLEIGHGKETWRFILLKCELSYELQLSASNDYYFKTNVSGG